MTAKELEAFRRKVESRREHGYMVVTLDILDDLIDNYNPVPFVATPQSTTR